MNSCPVRGKCCADVTLTTWAVLSALVVTVYAAPPTDVVERWLADESFYDLYSLDEQPQADDNGDAARDLCPPVPKVLPVGGCQLDVCSSDRECQQFKLNCCYNGCVYTCLPEVNPAPHIDWFREPRRRHQSGQSWLIPGTDDLVDVETCSTTPLDDDSDPLLCPHGYECNILDEGNPRKNIPNHGVCVKSHAKTSSQENALFVQEELTLYDANEDSESRHACDLGEGQKLLSGHEKVIDGQECKCTDTNLVCDES